MKLGRASTDRCQKKLMASVSFAAAIIAALLVFNGFLFFISDARRTLAESKHLFPPSVNLWKSGSHRAKLLSVGEFPAANSQRSRFFNVVYRIRAPKPGPVRYPIDPPSPPEG